MLNPEPDRGARAYADLPSPSPNDVLLDWQLVHTAEAVIVALAGELDMATAPTLRAVLTEILSTETLVAETYNPETHNPARMVVVDTAELRFCGASGLAALAEAAHRARTRTTQLRVVIPPDSHLARVWTMTGLGRDLPPYADREAATARGAPRPSAANVHRMRRKRSGRGP